MSKFKRAVVIDLAECTQVRAGVTGDRPLRAVFPSIVGAAPAIRRGDAFEWKAVAAAIHGVYGALGLHPEALPALIALPAGTDMRTRQHLARLAFTELKVPALRLVDAAVAALRAGERSTGVVVLAGDDDARSACGWQTPVSLFLGTFPWVYGARLGGDGPGMRWTTASSRPATLGLSAMASLMEPETNLRQDARQVAAIAEHFVRHTEALVRRQPVFAGPERGAAGRLFIRDRRLYVHQGSLHVAQLAAPRGALRASAYNYILDRFARFFAVRRAALRALSTLPPAVREAAARSTDPCLRVHVLETRRAG